MAEEKSYLQPLRDEMRSVEGEIQKREDELAELRKTRTTIGHALRGLDPQWAAEQKRKTKTAYRADGSYAVSDEAVQRVADYVAEHFSNGKTFVAKDIPLAAIKMSDPTRNAVLKRLHARGVIRLDNKAGRANIYAATSTS